MTGYYDYQELRAKAFETKAQEDINALGEWMERYGMDSWNGETFNIDEGYTLRPIHEAVAFDESGEPEEWEVTGYELW